LLLLKELVKVGKIKPVIDRYYWDRSPKLTAMSKKGTKREMSPLLWNIIAKPDKACGGYF
jgi:hypothetical protein